MPRGIQRLTRGAWGSQRGVTEAAWRRLWAAWGLPGDALGPAWATPKDHFGVKVDPKRHYFASFFLEAVFSQLAHIRNIAVATICHDFEKKCLN